MDFKRVLSGVVQKLIISFDQDSENNRLYERNKEEMEVIAA